MSTLLRQTGAICRQKERHLNYIFLSYIYAIYQQIHKSIFIVVPNVTTTQVIIANVRKNTLIIIVPNASSPQLHMCHMRVDTNKPYLFLWKMPALFSFTCAICQQIQGSLRYICAKFHNSSVTHVPYDSRYINTLVIFVPNARNPQLHMCHMSADRKTP